MRSNLAFLLLLAFGMAVFPGNASAQFRSETVELLSQVAIESAYGLVIPAADASLAKEVEADSGRRAASVTKLSDTRWSIQIQLREEDYQPDSKLVVISRDKDGKLLPGHVRWLNKPQTELGVAHAKCRKKRNTKSIARLMKLDEEQLENLVRIRRQKKVLLTNRLKRLLTPSLVEKLATLERESGLNYRLPISADMPLQEIASRMGVLMVVQRAQAKSRQKSSN